MNITLVTYENHEILDALETIVDHSSICEVVENLAHICYEKAEHLEMNWQDHETAKLWSKYGKILCKTAEKLETRSEE